nr:hypothetical protein GTC16762_16650 [Pigmentibacter ruber]
MEVSFMKKILQIIESAYRGTIEEQDDTVIWISHFLKDAGSSIDLLLKGNAISYLLTKQDSSGLVFGFKVQTQPAKIYEDLIKIMEKGVLIFYVYEDAIERGFETEEMIYGPQGITRADFPILFEKYDHILHW